MKNIALLILLLLAAFSCKKDAPNCLEGYTGDNCEEEIPPKSYLIKQLSVTKWPLYDDAGVAWDFGSNVDLYAKIFKNSTMQPIYISPIFENAESGYTQGWHTSIEYLSDDAVYVEIWDDDGGFSEDDFVGYCFVPYWELGQGFPTVKAITENGLTISYQLEYRF